MQPAKGQPVHDIRKLIGACRNDGEESLRWLEEQMHSYFFSVMQEREAVAALAMGLRGLGENRRLLLTDREKCLAIARLNTPGSLYDTLKNLRERDISFAYFAHSYAPIPQLANELEIQRFEFDRKSNREITEGKGDAPSSIRRSVAAMVKKSYPSFDLKDLGRLLRILWLNNERFVRLSSPERIAQVLWIFQAANRSGGIYLDVEETNGDGRDESRVLFAVANPPQHDFLLQVMEVFNRLGIGVGRAYCLTISNGVHPCFLGTFFVRRRDRKRMEKGSELFDRLRLELYNTQILATSSMACRDLVAGEIARGEDATLINAFCAFCHTTLARTSPNRFSAEEISEAFHATPAIALQLTSLFRLRFAPGIAGREARWQRECAEAQRAVAEYNTGHRTLDDMRRTIFQVTLLFIRHTLKTNFFVLEKQALSFRLDPAYLCGLGSEFTADLPSATPFRVTFFFGRHGAGYHIGFSDIARGGWRTVIARHRDDCVTWTGTLFKEAYVLAHTQHLKNKDIYEGGSKMVVLLDAVGIADPDLITWRLYKLQYGLINAFLDILITEEGRARDSRVVDYYAEDEPVELGPDENMHDGMIEEIARLSRQRGYILGAGIISSKKVGINHREYGVTSAGVMKFAEVTLAEIGIKIDRDPFSVKFTGGPNGDVAGNAMRIILERCPAASIRLIIDGAGALHDPAGIDREGLSRILLAGDIDRFPPDRLQEGGFLLCSRVRRKEGLAERFLKIAMIDGTPVENWLSVDEFHREMEGLIFSVPADLFIPAGGRPETVDGSNWERFFPEGLPATLRVVVEGANSFFTPAARIGLQKRGVVIMRDASANKCGVISSSYEIIANLLMSDAEFLAEKERYVADVLAILERRAEEEARFIFRKRRESGGSLSFTEISDSLSHEINGHYARLFDYFRARPQLCRRSPYREAALRHLPAILRQERKYRLRLAKLPPKYLYAILAAEIGSSLVYRGDPERAFEAMVTEHLHRSSRASEV